MPVRAKGDVPDVIARCRQGTYALSGSRLQELDALALPAPR